MAFLVVIPSDVQSTDCRVSSFIDRIANFDADLSRRINTSLEELPASQLLLSPRFLQILVLSSKPDY